MNMILAIDGGTTNTRLTLIDGDAVLGRTKIRVGARDASLQEAVRDGIRDFLAEQSISLDDISAIYASGMITSDAGLYTLAHIPAPAGAAELARGAVSVSLPDVCAKPITFIPGVKVMHGGMLADVMRGEETEIAGILQEMRLSDAILILPGSHMKLVHVRGGQITDFSTSLSGELSRAAAEHTILSRSLGDAFPKLPDIDFLRRGRDLLQTCGSMNAALFKVRVATIAGNTATQEQLYSMLLGIVLAEDVKSLTADAPILVGGSNPFRTAYLTLVRDAGCDAREIPEELAENAAARGVMEIHRILA